jgi:membrane-associated phospholipid phosphatase
VLSPFKQLPTTLLTRPQQCTDTVAALYFLITGAIVSFHHAQLPGWRVYLSVHLLAATGICMLRRLPLRRLTGITGFFRDWYPVLLFPVLYKEVEQFALAFGDWRLTKSIQQLEVALFDGHPSLYASWLYPWVPLSEYLHFCYFAYLLLLPIVGGWWYFSGRRHHFHELMLLVSTTLLSSYIFYISYPVDSPFYLFRPLEAPLTDGFFYRLVHFFSERGGARGGAFPSAHVSVSLVIWLVAWQRQRLMAWVLAPVIAGLVGATVYGRFHYLLDVLAGLLVAVLVTESYRLCLAARVPSLQPESAFADEPR